MLVLPAGASDVAVDRSKLERAGVLRIGLFLCIHIFSFSVTILQFGASVLSIFGVTNTDDSHNGEAAAFSSICALTPLVLQFFCTPVAGVLSDRGYGRKVFLYISVIGIIASQVRGPPRCNIFSMTGECVYMLFMSQSLQDVNGFSRLLDGGIHCLIGLHCMTI
jgi:hypothetical protein